MVLVIPGVEVRVVKDVVSPQLSPSGVLGITGLTEKAPAGTQSVQSWSRFVELYGPGSAYSMPDAVQALQNGVSQLVVSPVDPGTARSAAVTIPGDKGDSFTLKARAPGTWANGLVIGIASRSVLGNPVLDVTVSSGNAVLESLPGLPAASADQLIAARSSLLGATRPGLKLGPKPLKLMLAGGDDGDASKPATPASISAPADKGEAFILTAREPGAKGNTIAVTFTARTDLERPGFDVTIVRGAEPPETLAGVWAAPADPPLDQQIAAGSKLVLAAPPAPKIGTDPLKLVLAGGGPPPPPAQYKPHRQQK
jgi:hypothetical protein